jgi:hypothetical protein
MLLARRIACWFRGHRYRRISYREHVHGVEERWACTCCMAVRDTGIWFETEDT